MAYEKILSTYIKTGESESWVTIDFCYDYDGIHEALFICGPLSIELFKPQLERLKGKDIVKIIDNWLDEELGDNIEKYREGYENEIEELRNRRNDK